jgi:YidC/Oxa1 family membrane protein insertase
VNLLAANPLSPLEDVMSNILEWFHATMGLPWAWSIVAITLLVRILLVPVAVRQIHSMQSLQMHAPEMKAIQQRWKHDRQRQSEELMKFYRENKINPYASCLPIVFQIPIFISLYYTLRHFEGNFLEQGSKYAHDSVTWLHLVDITEPTKDSWGPLLLCIYVISQLTSTYLMSNQLQSAAQRWMIMVLPVIFIPFILNFPSGLMIYWLTTNLWTTGQGIVTRRLLPRPVPPPKRTSRTPPKESSPAGEPAAAAASSGPARSGPPRRVKKKRGGGRPRR